MSTNETVVVIIIVMALVILAALCKFDHVVTTIGWRGVLSFVLKALGGTRRTTRAVARGPRKPKRRTKGLRPWFALHWRAMLSAVFMLVLWVVPACWWFQQPASWRMLLSSQFNETLNMLRHSPKAPLHIARGKATLDQLTRMIEMRSDSLGSDRYEDEEVWIIDHYWQYWNTTNFRDYLAANKMLVSRGGKIHRMFVLTDEELSSPRVQSVLHEQCEIGRIDSDKTGNGFELWRADPKKMKNADEYQTMSRAFQELPGTEKSFENYDVVKFKDTVYYSSDFSTDYSVLGSSTWLFDPTQVNKIDLSRLFRKSIAERISCDEPSTLMKTARL